MTPPPRGYAWWYVDGISDDGTQGITLIAFLGSVFSPYYALARRFGGGDPLRHCCLNVALYGRPGGWAMTERAAGSVRRSPSSLAIGPSRLEWNGRGLTVRIDEVGMPIPRRIRGTVRLIPQAVEAIAWPLDPASRHRWQPIAPCARIEVRLDRPSVDWNGSAYFDSNDGDAPLEDDFLRWDWARAPVEDGAAVLYHAERPDGLTDLALRFRQGGGVETLEPPPRIDLPQTRWRIPRAIAAEAPWVAATLEDTPFYARSLVSLTLLGERVTAMHESLSLTRFRHPLVQAMLPFRMPRRMG